ncbi:MAG: alpha/beta hydrolase [Clostridia bacterium]|nr:alpha/beta hydrolase [Clostridia bacterium]
MKSLSAKIMTGLLRFWPKLTAEESEQKMLAALEEGEKQTPPPKNIVTRYEDSENGRVFYANEKGVSRYTVFYIHGGAYRYDFIAPHWQFIEKLVKETNALVIAPGYRLAPFATYKEAFDLIVPLYKKHCEEHPEKKIIMMGDSAGGGLSLALAEYFKAEGIRLPDELVLFSPWVDVSMENEQIPEYQPLDPMIAAPSASAVAKRWAGDIDIHDPKVSPIYGDLTGLRNVTVFLGTDEVLYPDVTKMFNMLDKDVSNELIVGEGMNHVYPLNPIEEAIPACHKVFHIVMR